MDTKALRQRILDLAIRGKLVPQDPNDEPASVLLERIRAEKERLITEGKIKRSKSSTKGRSQSENSKSTSAESHYQNFTPPFPIPASWEWVKLDDIGIWQAGGTPSRANKSYYGGDIPWLKTGDLNDGLIVRIPEGITQEAVDNSSAKLNPAGSILMAMYGATIGKLGILTFPATTNQACCACVKYFGVQQDYLFYFLLSQRNAFIAKGGGGAQPNISKEIITSTDMPLPPISEQKNIVSEIQRLFKNVEHIENGQKDLISNIQQVKTKILDLAIHGKLVPQNPADEPAAELLHRVNPNARIITDNPQYGNIPEHWTLCELGSIFSPVSAKRVHKLDWQESGIPFYRAREIVKLHSDGFVENELFISQSHYDELKEKYGVPKEEDIMLSAVGSIGRTYIVRATDCFYYKDASVLCLRNIHRMYSKYFAMLFDSTFLQHQMYEYSKGTTVDTITIENLKSYQIPLPPLTEQKRIISKIEELFAVLDEIQKSLEA